MCVCVFLVLLFLVRGVPVDLNITGLQKIGHFDLSVGETHEIW